MDVGAGASRFPPHHQQHLGVGLQPDHAVDDLDSCPLELTRPADVGLFVEARLQFDQRGDRLAGLGRLDQGLDDRRIVAGAIEGELDRHDVRILGRLADELDHDVEGLERMVDDDVLGADRREAIVAVVANATGKARRMGRKLQIAALIDDQLVGIDQAKDAIDDGNLVVAVLQLVGHESA